jgi:phage terminase large subunit GpA-like protein
MRTADQAKLRFRLMVRDLVRSTLKPTPRMTVPEWADTYRILPKTTSAISGRWRTREFEVARGPMMAVTEPGVQVITVACCTQVLKTELLQNIIGYHVHLDPCPMLLVQPKDEAVDAFSKERLAPMVQVCPELRAIMGDGRTRRSEDTMRFKTFPGGYLAMASAGSPTNLAMRAIRITLLDEVDKYETTKEGDPIKLAEERSSTFAARRLSVRACSPTWEETSRVWASYQESDQRRAYVPCPHCSWWQVLDFFKHVQWQRKGNGHHDPDTAAIMCENCGAEWSEDQRLDALAEIEWRQTRSFVCCGEGQDPRQARKWDWDQENQVGRAVCTKCGRRAVGNRHAGFQASKLYSPRTTMPQLAAEWLGAKDSPEKQLTFYNTQLGLPFRIQATKEVSAASLIKRQEKWEGEVPNDVLVITAGIDVHPGTTGSEGRLELETVGWGLGEESWSLAHEVFTGDPAQRDVWDELDEFLLQPMVRVDGREMATRAACIDSGGHNTQDVYAFASVRGGRNVWAVKGASDRGGQWSPIWPSVSRSKPQFRAGYRPVVIGVNAAKEAVRQRLLISEPGPGYCHFPIGRPPAYYDQMTSERLVIRNVAGQMTRRWEIGSHQANEALDVRVYAYTALWGLYHVRRLRLDRIAQWLDNNQPAEHEAPQPVGQPVLTPPAHVVARPQLRHRRTARSSYV